MWYAELWAHDWNWLYVHTYSVMSDSCDPVDCSPPSSSVHGILQGRILEQFAIYCFKGSSQSRDQTQVSCIIFTNRFKRTHLLEARIDVEKKGRRPLLWAMKKVQVASDPVCDVFLEVETTGLAKGIPKEDENNRDWRTWWSFLFIWAVTRKLVFNKLGNSLLILEYLKLIFTYIKLISNCTSKVGDVAYILFCIVLQLSHSCFYCPEK